MFKELIWVKDNSLSESFCNRMIEKFDVDPYRVKGKVDQNNPRVDKSLKITMDMGVTTNPTWQEEDKVLFKALVLLFSISKDSINIILSSNNFDERADFKAKIFSFLLRLNE